MNGKQQYTKETQTKQTARGKKTGTLLRINNKHILAHTKLQQHIYFLTGIQQLCCVEVYKTFELY